jgi:hypothetical protein
VDQAVGVFLGAFRRVAPQSFQLATTAALEHYTAVLAEQLLMDDAFNQFEVPEKLRGLFQWHALEECEHRAVAFDVFEDRYGSEFVRILAMQVATGLILGLVPPMLLVSLVTDRDGRNPLRLARSIVKIRRSPFARKRIGLNLLQYSRVGFHPDQRNITALLTRWRKDLFGENGTLMDYLDPGQRKG